MKDDAMKVKVFLVPVIAAAALGMAGPVFADVAGDARAPDESALTSAARTDDTVSKGAGIGSSTQISYGHRSATDCAECHGESVEPRSSGDVPLVTPVPRLCFGCHEQYVALDGWVHGPVATGDCLLCHTPHQITDQTSLTAAIPDLCYRCHTTSTLQLVAGHSDRSYAQCGNCHTSHASLSRKLLKPDFLRTDVGAAYRDREARHRLQYVFVDPRGSLVGLAGLRVVAAIERPEAFERYGLTEDSLKKEVELRLQQSGISTLSDEKSTSRQPGLHVCLRLVELPLRNRSPQAWALSGELSLSLRQTVELLWRSSDAERRICTATTWDTSALVVWGTPQIREGFRDAIRVVVDKFCRDYLAANSPNEVLPPDVNVEKTGPTSSPARPSVSLKQHPVAVSDILAAAGFQQSARVLRTSDVAPAVLMFGPGDSCTLPPPGQENRMTCNFSGNSHKQESFMSPRGCARRALSNAGPIVSILAGIKEPL